MKSKYFFMVVTIIILSVFFTCSAQADMYRLKFDAFTSNFTDNQQLNVQVRVFDTEFMNPADFIDSITITAPDGTTFSMTIANNWVQYVDMFQGFYRADDFNSGKIPGGTYKVTVLALSGKKLTSTDSVVASFLPVPVITLPAGGSIVGAAPTIKWQGVSGANEYRVLLWDEGRSMPVYWLWEKQLYVNGTRYTLPLGDLRPKSSYRLAIEARAGYQDLDKKSRSDWISFNTKNWE